VIPVDGYRYRENRLRLTGVLRRIIDSCQASSSKSREKSWQYRIYPIFTVYLLRIQLLHPQFVMFAHHISNLESKYECLRRPPEEIRRDSMDLEFYEDAHFRGLGFVDCMRIIRIQMNFFPDSRSY